MIPPKVYGLIGYPVTHSFSPAMQNAAFKALAIHAEYRLFEVKPEELQDFLLNDILVKDIHGNAVYARDILGFNITIPHKINAKRILGEAFPCRAEQEIAHYMEVSGAINTVKRVGDKLKYRNTDVPGFSRSLKQDLKFNSKDKSAFLIGCGGAGRAVIASLTWKGAYIKKIYVYESNRDAVKSARRHFSQFPFMEKRLEFIFEEQVSKSLSQCQLLINASPVGMKESDPSPIDKKLLAKNKGLCVYDVVYNRQTQLIKDAKELGYPAAGGIGMLLYQGIQAFEYWTGKKAPEALMRKALEKEMLKCRK
jgi:shikimate dehydrogenase